MAGYDVYIERCQQRFAFLEARGLVRAPPFVDAPRECVLSWAGPSISVGVYAEYHGAPSVTLGLADGALGLHEALPLLAPDLPTPPPKDPLAWVDFWASFLEKRWSDLLDPPLLRAIRDARDAEKQRWCGAFFDEARPAFAFLVEEHGYREPCPSTLPTQCSLTWHRPPKWVLVHRTEGRETGVWVKPGDVPHFDLAATMAEHGSLGEDLAAAAAFLRAHPELLGPGGPAGSRPPSPRFVGSPADPGADAAEEPATGAGDRPTGAGP